MTNADIARVFSHIAIALEIDGANPFRIRAYREAARVVAESGEPMATLAAEPGRIEQIRGIGKDLAGKIRDIVQGGTTPLYEEMKTKYPLEVIGFTEIPGMGPKRARTLFDHGIRTRDDLERAAREQRLRALPGFGQTVEKNVLARLAATAGPRRLLLAGAWPIAHAIADHVRAVPGVERVEIAGSFRRRRETVGDLDILVCGGDKAKVMEAFTTYPEAAEVLGHGDTRSSIRTLNDLQVDIRHVPPESFGAAMLYFTGSKAHNIELRRIALAKGMSLSEYALTRGDTVVAGRTEEEVYRALGMAWIPPELREARDEIALAIEGRLPRLIEQSDLLGDLHLHTDRTDGRLSLEAMVREVRDRGFAYCAITDHSKALAMSGGFDDARVRQSVDEIAAVRRQVPGITVLHGLEVDILADGALDLGDDALALLDWVIVSLHSRLGQPGPEMTARVLRAIEHPAVCVMGHPTARRIDERPPAAFDVERVLGRAAELGVAMEINAQPPRMDLSDVNARLARERGVPLVISTDAHSVAQLDALQYGVFVARRAGVGPADVLNTRPIDDLMAWIEQRKRKGGRPAKTKSVATPAVKSPAVATPLKTPAASKATARPATKATAKTIPRPAAKHAAKSVARTSAKAARPRGKTARASAARGGKR